MRWKCLKMRSYRWLEVLKIEKVIKKKVTCPFCANEQKVQYAPDAKCRGVFIKCQARHCKKIFEIRINQDK